MRCHPQKKELYDCANSVKQFDVTWTKLFAFGEYSCPRGNMSTYHSFMSSVRLAKQHQARLNAALWIKYLNAVASVEMQVHSRRADLVSWLPKQEQAC